MEESLTSSQTILSPKIAGADWYAHVGRVVMGVSVPFGRAEANADE